MPIKNSSSQVATQDGLFDLKNQTQNNFDISIFEIDRAKLQTEIPSSYLQKFIDKVDKTENTPEELLLVEELKQK
jgi:hypothetical protein